MAKVGRNAPCPCGSGKKYKKCCWTRDQASTVEAARVRSNHPQMSMPVPPPAWVDDGLDELSNRVVDLINAGEYGAAEAGCRELKGKFPEVIDWLDRTAMLHEAKGETELAIDFYQRCLDFIAQSPDDYETGPIYQDAIERLRHNAKTEAPPATS